MFTLFHMFMATYRLIVTLWNACFVLHQIVRSVIREAKREAVELMALLDNGAPVMTSLLQDTNNPWQMLIIARASSFVLLLQLSKHRVLQLEVDENFIISKLEVICTELLLRIQEVPRLLRLPIGTHDTRLARYTPIKLPDLWKEIQTEARYGGGGGTVSTAIVPGNPTAMVRVGNADTEGRTHRKKYVQLLTESAMRRRLHMDPLPAASDITSKGDMGIAKTHDEHVVKRKALVNATNTQPEWNAGGDVASEVPNLKMTVTGASKQARIRAVLSENLSISNLAQAATLRKAAENTQQPRRAQSLRRKRGQFDLYAQGASSEFSLLSKMGQGVTEEVTEII